MRCWSRRWTARSTGRCASGLRTGQGLFRGIVPRCVPRARIMRAGFQCRMVEEKEDIIGVPPRLMISLVCRLG